MACCAWGPVLPGVSTGTFPKYHVVEAVIPVVRQCLLNLTRDAVACFKCVSSYRMVRCNNAYASPRRRSDHHHHRYSTCSRGCSLHWVGAFVVVQHDDWYLFSETFTEDQRKEIASTAESFSFQAEVTRLMDIIINSLYTQKEVFLRELISNAADALEKARFMSVSEPGYLGDNSELEVRVDLDKEAKTITIQDNGIGMTRDDLVNNLGTVARSGTTNFLEAMAESGDLNLIGQFGVGFYSAFLVADRVTVTSKNNADPDQHIWESMIGGSFTVARDPRGDTLGRGTRITLHLKDDSTEFLEESMVRSTILKFNQFVNFPIKLRISREVKPDKKRGAAAEGDDDIPDMKDDEEPLEDDEEEQPEDKATEKKKEEEPEKLTKKEDATKEEKEAKSDESTPKKDAEEKTTPAPPVIEHTWEVINSQKPIWMRPKENVTEEEYLQFYKALARDTDPVAYTHFSAEGEIEFKSILYIPAHAPYDAWSAYFAAKQESIKLYARRVLVADSVYELLPKWLNFIKGVVDSDDLPLKVDRESFSQSRVIRVISKKVVAKFLELLKKLSKDDLDAWETYRKEKEENKTAEAPRTKFDKVWNAFGRNLKVGCVEDDSSRDKIMRISRWTSTRTREDEKTTLDAYISRMPEEQKAIYYVSNDNFEAANHSPYMQFYKKKEYEVIILTEPLEEPCFERVRTYEGKKLVSIEKGSHTPDSDEKEDQKTYRKQLKKAFEPLTKLWGKYLKSLVGGVRITQRLVEDPAVVTASEFGHTAFGDRVARAQMFSGMESKYDWMGRYLELNPSHPLIKKMLELAKANPEGDDKLEEAAKIVYDAALFSSGYVVEDPTLLSRRFFRLLQSNIGVAEDAAIEDYQLSPEEIAQAEETKQQDDKKSEEESLDDDDGFGAPDDSPVDDEEPSEKKEEEKKDDDAAAPVKEEEETSSQAKSNGPQDKDEL